MHDRDSLILAPLMPENRKLFYLDEGMKELLNPVHLKIEAATRNISFKISDSRDVAYIDADKLQFPLLVRKWQQGDYFRPLGMEGFKKVSDFFIDQKLSLPQKEKVWIIANGEQVVWIIGHRLDDRFKITSQTKMILRIELVR